VEQYRITVKAVTTARRQMFKPGLTYTVSPALKDALGDAIETCERD
jgi:hypothetical protein